MEAFTWHSLRTKLAAAFFVVVVAMVGLAALVADQTQRVQHQIDIERTSTGLFDLIREVRYREFRLVIYRKPAELADLVTAIADTEAYLARQSALLDAAAESGDLEAIRSDLVDYRALVQRYWDRDRFTRGADAAAEEDFRELRRRFVSRTESLSRVARHNVERQLDRQSKLFGAGVFGLGVLLVAVAQFLIGRLLRPLRSIESEMEKVAEGRIRRVEFDWRDQELVSLANAFNHVMSELERRQADMVQSEKLASLGTMLSGVAHELNNPLSNISTTAQILLEDVDHAPRERLRTLLGRIDQQSERARTIVRTLLEHARADRPTPVRSTVLSLVAEAIQTFNQGRSTPRAILVDVAPGIEIECVPDRLQRALINILDNAAQATDNADPIVLMARGVPDEPAAARVEIAIQDCGSGMAEGLRRRAFDPFFTTKPAGQGTGLGLFIAHDIVRQHRGQIDILSLPGAGTTVTIRLPVRPPYAAT